MDTDNSSNITLHIDLLCTSQHPYLMWGKVTFPFNGYQRALSLSPSSQNPLMWTFTLMLNMFLILLWLVGKYISAALHGILPSYHLHTLRASVLHSVSVFFHQSVSYRYVYSSLLKFFTMLLEPMWNCWRNWMVRGGTEIDQNCLNPSQITKIYCKCYTCWFLSPKISNCEMFFLTHIRPVELNKPLLSSR